MSNGSRLITFNCQVETIQSRKDSTLKIVIGTQELTEGGKLFPLQNKFCTIGIVPNDELSDSDIALLQSSKIGIDDIPNQKSQSQRLRNVLFILWKQDSAGYDDFNLFYQNRMDKLIEQVKAKLEP